MRKLFALALLSILPAASSVADLVPREGRAFVSSGGKPAWASSAWVQVYDVGGQVAIRSSGTAIELRTGHGFAIGDKLIVGIDASRYRTVIDATATAIAVDHAVPVSEGDILLNLGADTGLEAPAYDGSTIAIYDSMDGASPPIRDSRVATDASGGYRYWKADGVAVWELLRSSQGVPIGFHLAGIAASGGGILAGDLDTVPRAGEVEDAPGTGGVSGSGGPAASPPPGAGTGSTVEFRIPITADPQLSSVGLGTASTGNDGGVYMLAPTESVRPGIYADVSAPVTIEDGMGFHMAGLEFHGNRDNVLCFGYNVAACASRIDQSELSAFMALEGTYDSSPEPGRQDFSEWNYNVISPAGTAWRPWAAGVEWAADSGRGAFMLAVRTDSHYADGGRDKSALLLEPAAEEGEARVSVNVDATSESRDATLGAFTRQVAATATSKGVSSSATIDLESDAASAAFTGIVSDVHVSATTNGVDVGTMRGSSSTVRTTGDATGRTVKGIIVHENAIKILSTGSYANTGTYTIGSYHTLDPSGTNAAIGMVDYVRLGAPAAAGSQTSYSLRGIYVEDLGSAGGFVAPIQIERQAAGRAVSRVGGNWNSGYDVWGDGRFWYDHTNDRFRWKNGSAPSSETDGTEVVGATTSQTLSNKTVNGGQTSYARVTADVSDSAAGGPTSVTGLSLAMTAGRYYKIDCVLSFSTASPSTGLALGFRGPAATNRSCSMSIAAGTDGDAEGGYWQGLSNADDDMVTAIGSYAGTNSATVQCQYLPSANGSWQLRFDTEADASAVTIEQGSLCEFVDVK
jgi:hypothetical protein